MNRVVNKIIPFDKIASYAVEQRNKGNTIVFTNGCFDLLHRGHVEYLVKAAELGSELIIGLNSDASVKMLEKGDLRPIKDETTRAIILASFEFVSAVVIFNEATPLKLIQTINPDFLVKGGDWSIDTIVGAKEVKSKGGKVLSIPIVEGYSTTNYVEKIQNG